MNYGSCRVITDNYDKVNAFDVKPPLRSDICGPLRANLVIVALVGV